MRSYLFCLCFAVAVYQQPVGGLTITALDESGSGSTAILHGDMDGDLDVDLRDYQLFAAGFSAASNQLGYSRYSDLDANGWVGLADFFVFADHFGHRLKPKFTELSGGREQGLAARQRAVSGDVDGDGDVDLHDFFKLADAFAALGEEADLNGDDRLNLDDFYLVIRNFGTQPGRPEADPVGRRQRLAKPEKPSFTLFTFVPPPVLPPLRSAQPTRAANGAPVGASFGVTGPLEPGLLTQIPALNPAEPAHFPVPESTTLVLFAAGLVGIFCGARWLREGEVGGRLSGDR